MMRDDHIIFYVDPNWRRVGIHSPFLNPWWGNPFPASSVFSRQMFDNFSFDISHYSITDDIKNAEAVFAPYGHNWLLKFDEKLLDECIKTAKINNLPLLIDGSSDIEHPIEKENIYILRYGGYNFLPEKNRIQIPLCVDDVLERCRNGKLEIREKSGEKAVIGFVGWARITPMQYLRNLIKEIPILCRSIFDSRYLTLRKGVLWRGRIIKLLQKSSKVRLKFHSRSSFSANPKSAPGDMRQLQEEMVSNILQSDYALDVRGDANNSARLFEILALGRIPIIIDTCRNFPFSDFVDYSSFALIIDFRDIKKIPEIIENFHNNISPEHFKEMQKNARNAYISYFRIDAFMKYIVRDLKKNMLE